MTLKPAEHTSGPWEVLDPYIYSNGTRQYPIAEIKRGRFDPVMQDANARLIAAAPDMLEALEGMVCVFGGRAHKVVRQAQAAIATAKGDDE